MNVVILLLIFIVTMVVFINLLLLLLWSGTDQDETSHTFQYYPFVSVLVAARDEALNIRNCLEALLAVDYPEDRIEILIGDDDSSDDTYKIAHQIVCNNSRVNVIKITNQLGQARGKANVLAQLAHAAQGEYYLITDADVQVPPTWVKGLLSGVGDHVGIVNGFTTVKGNFWQNTDWTFALGMVKVITDYSRPVTAMGNNMLISKEAYQSVGGYEHLPFSVTEDFELFKHVKNRGYRVVQLASPAIKAITLPQRGYLALINQRKRWMIGAVQLPWQVVGLLLFQALYYPSIIVLFIFMPYLAGFIFIVKMVIQALFVGGVAKRLDVKLNFFQLMLYEGYSTVVSLGTGIFYLLPIRIKWKGRKY